MKPESIYDYKKLRWQLDHQKSHVWDLEQDINWDQGIDLSRGFLPMDADYIAFPGASSEQQLALSQLMGIIVNSTISEMEDVANKLRHVAWREVLDSYPVNPEMYQLGEQFFEEEAKHSAAFCRFNDQFCKTLNIEPAQLDYLIPKGYGSIFQKATLKNAQAGGHAFWWVVAAVEEVALLIYQSMYRHRKEIDPLYYELHKKHFEEESKHTNYAFLMLDVIAERNKSLKKIAHKKLDLLYSELFSSAWVISEIHKIKRVKELESKHEFFKVLSSCLPLLEKMPRGELVKKVFVSAPYLSLILNGKHHKLSQQSAKDHGAIHMPFPTPKASKTNLAMLSDGVDKETVWKIKN